MSAQAPQSAHTVIWNPIYSPFWPSSQASDYTSLETRSSEMRNLSPVMLTSSSSGGAPSETSTLDDTFLTLSKRCADIPTVREVPGPTSHSPRTTKACKDCKRRKVRCGERDTCHRVFEATTSELERQLYVTNKELGKANEKIEAMDAENKNLQQLNFELLQRLRQTPDTFDTRNRIWQKNEGYGGQLYAQPHDIVPYK